MYPRSKNVTRLIERLLNATKPDALTIGEINGIVNAFDAVARTDKAVLPAVNHLARYRQQLTANLDKRLWARSAQTPGQLNFDGEEVTL